VCRHLKSKSSTSKKFVRWLRNGTEARLEELGIASTVGKSGGFKQRYEPPKFVLSAASLLRFLQKRLEKQNFAPAVVKVKHEGILAWMMKYAPAPFVEKVLRLISIRMSGIAAFLVRRKRAVGVYDITVEDTHEFFADGILVSNCDGLRYVTAFICMKHKAFRGIRELIIDKRASFRSDSERAVQDLGSGYVQIHPNALYRGKRL
jgi:hypothetical protein